VLAREIESADRIDLLIAFIKWNGFRLLEEPIARFLAAGKLLRIITTRLVYSS
jgi:HKD family nuclease